MFKNGMIAVSLPGMASATYLNYLRTAVRWLLILTALTPLVVSNATIYPFVFPKIVFYRVLVEIALALALVYAVMLPGGEFKNLLASFLGKIKKSTRNPALIFLALFFISLAVSAILADNGYRAFWGDIERGVGVFGFIHFYLFTALTLAFFDSKAWGRFLKLSLVVGSLLMGFAFLEYFGWKFLFLHPPQQSRPESLIGNSAFLATHLIFLIMFAAAVFYSTRINTDNTLIHADKKSASISKIGINQRFNKFWRYFSALVITLSFITIFITGTRGAILGVGAGLVALLLYFAIFGHSKSSQPSREASAGKLGITMSTKLSLRSASLFLIALLIIFSGVFWTTRTNNFWQKVPGLDRLSRTATLDVNDPSTQFRLITWRVSWKAFKERPLLGWGSENYIVAYEKHYDPDYALYGETWLDRAHNTFFDVLVMQGLFGVLSYFGLIFALFYVVIKTIGKKSFYLAAVLIAGMVAYVVQNLVLFDQIVSYATFFALIGYILHLEKQEEMLPGAELRRSPSYRHGLFVKYASVLVIPISLYSVFAWNLNPYLQGIAFRRSPGISGNAHDVEEAIKQATTPYNFAQYNIRSQGIDTVYLGAYFDNESYVSNPKFRPLGKTLIEMIGELVRREPYDVRTQIRLVEMLNDFSIGMTEEEIAKTKIFETAENLMRDAVRRAPTRQEVYYHLAFNLAAQKKFDEAVEVAQYAIDLQPKVARAHYHLGLVLALAGRNAEAQKAIAKAEELAPNFERFLPTDLNNIAIFYKTWGFADKYADLAYRTLPKVNENRISHTFGREPYEDALRYYILNRNAGRAIPIAEYLGKTFPDLKEDMAKIKILLQKEDWRGLPELPSNNNTNNKTKITIMPSREYYEGELRRYILNKDKENAIKAAEYLLNNYHEYALDVGIETVLDLVKKEKWEILNKL